MTCAPNGGCPLILTVRWPQSGSMMCKRVVVDVGGLLLEGANDARGGALDLPDGGGGPRHQDQEHAPRHRVGGQVLLGDLVLPVAPAAVDDRNVVGLGKRPDP